MKLVRELQQQLSDSWDNAEWEHLQYRIVGLLFKLQKRISSVTPKQKIMISFPYSDFVAYQQWQYVVVFKIKHLTVSRVSKIGV